MRAFQKYYDNELVKSSPVCDDLVRVVNYDADGNEFVTWQKFDYPTFQESLGTVDVWSLDALLKAGINPDFPIHTGNNTRLEGVGVVSQAAAIADSILSDVEPKE